MIKINLRRDYVLALILAIGTFFRFYRLPELMIFGGDIAREYLAARDITLKGIIPLLGCPTSITWLNQGPLFTYILGIILPFFKYNPLIGGYFTAFCGVISIFIIYKLGSYFFSKSVGVFAALFYSTSPLVIINDRYPFYQSFVSLLTMLFFLSLYLTIKNNKKYFILSFFIFGILMQFELSNIIFAPILTVFLIDYRKEIKIKEILIGAGVFILTWLPKIIYDLNHGFSQTIGFIYWMGYRLLPINVGSKSLEYYSLSLRFTKIFTEFSRLIFWPSFWISLIIFLIAIIFLVKQINLRSSYGSFKKNHLGVYLTTLWLLFPLLALFLHGSPEGSYMPIFFAVPPLLIGNFIDKQTKNIKYVFLFLLLFLTIFNGMFLIKNNYFMVTGNDSERVKRYNFGQSYKLSLEMAKYITSDSGKEKYNLVALGDFAYFPSAKMNFEYLNWYLKNPPSPDKEELKYYLYYNYDNKKEIKNTVSVKVFPYMTVVKQRSNKK